MQTADQLIWRAWLQVWGNGYDRFDYNVRVGPGVTPPDSLVEPWLSASVNASKLRADVIGWQGAAATIFEVERYAKADAVGQLLAYRAAWEAESTSNLSPSLALVCADWNPSIGPALTEHGIELYIYPVDFTQLAPPRIRS
jgi:hypothetical protein